MKFPFRNSLHAPMCPEIMTDSRTHLSCFGNLSGKTYGFPDKVTKPNYLSVKLCGIPDNLRFHTNLSGRLDDFPDSPVQCVSEQIPAKCDIMLIIGLLLQ